MTDAMQNEWFDTYNWLAANVWGKRIEFFDEDSYKEAIERTTFLFRNMSPQLQDEFERMFTDLDMGNWDTFAAQIYEGMLKVDWDETLEAGLQTS